MPKDKLYSLDSLLEILNLIKENEAYQKHIQVLWDIDGLSDRLKNRLLDQYYMQHPQEDPGQIDSVINFINYLIDKHSYLKFSDNQEERTTPHCNIL